jgi:hypothetical protein
MLSLEPVMCDSIVTKDRVFIRFESGDFKKPTVFREQKAYYATSDGKNVLRLVFEPITRLATDHL